MGYPESFNELEKWRDELRLASSPKKLIRTLENSVKREADPVRLRILNRFLAEEHIAQERPGAAAAIRAEDPVWQMHLWYEALRYEDEEKDLLPILQERLRIETHPMKVSALRGFLIDEYQNREDYAAATAVYLDKYNADPSEPMPLISLAGQKLHIEDQPEDAMRFATQAVDVALRAGVWRRLALGTKARTAVRLRDYPVVEDMIKKIMELTFTRGNADIGVERDFLDRLPPGSIDPGVARQYDEYCRARGRLPQGGPDGPDEPPAFELPEWELPEWKAKAQRRGDASADEQDR